MKSCSKNLKQLDSQRELYSGLDLIFLSEYFLLMMKVSSQILEKFLRGTTRVYQGSLLFLSYVNYMPQAVRSILLLYADDRCILYQHKEVYEIRKQLNKYFQCSAMLLFSHNQIIRAQPGTLILMKNRTKIYKKKKKSLDS